VTFWVVAEMAFSEVRKNTQEPPQTRRQSKKTNPEGLVFAYGGAGGN